MPKHFGVYFASYPRPMRMFFIAFFAMLFFFAGVICAAQSLKLTIGDDVMQGAMCAIVGACLAIVINFVITKWLVSQGDRLQAVHAPLNMDLFSSDDEIDSPSDLGFH